MAEGWLTTPPAEPLAACPPARVANDATLLVADRARDAVVRLEPDGARTDVVTAGDGGASIHEVVDRPVDVAVGPEGELFVASFGRGSVLRFEAQSGEYLGVVFHDPLVLDEPSALHWSEARLLVVGNDSSNLLALGADGEVLDIVGDGMLRGPLDLAVEPSTGLLHVTAQAVDPVQGVQVWDFEASTRDSSYGARDTLGITVGVTFDCRGDAIVAGPDGVHLLAPDEDGGFTPVQMLSSDPASRLRTDAGGAVWMSSPAGLSRLDRDAGTFVVVHEADDLLVDPRGFTFE